MIKEILGLSNSRLNLYEAMAKIHTLSVLPYCKSCIEIRCGNMFWRWLPPYTCPQKFSKYSGMGPSSGRGLTHIILINILFTMTFLGVKAPQPLAHVIDYFRKRLFSGRLPEYKNYFPENKKLFSGIFWKIRSYFPE